MTARSNSCLWTRRDIVRTELHFGAKLSPSRSHGPGESFHRLDGCGFVVLDLLLLPTWKGHSARPCDHSFLRYDDPQYHAYCFRRDWSSENLHLRRTCFDARVNVLTASSSSPSYSVNLESGLGSDILKEASPNPLLRVHQVSCH